MEILNTAPNAIPVVGSEKAKKNVDIIKGSKNKIHRGKVFL